MSRVLIAGCGYVGTELGIRLAGAGHDVWGLRRNPGTLPPSIRPVAADLRAPLQDTALPRVDRVVYAVGADAPTAASYRNAYVSGVRHLLAALGCQAGPPAHLFFLSSTAVYGDAEGSWVDERTEPAPENFRGATVLEGEALVHGADRPGTCVRLGGIYGPGRTRLLERARRGELRCPPGGPVWSNRIHRDDVAGVLGHLLFRAGPAPVYLAVDDEPAPLCEVYRYVAALMGGPEPTVGASVRRTPTNKRCSNALLAASGYSFRYPTYREGYRVLADALL